MMKILNEQGKEGWEVVNILKDKESVDCFFRRKVSSRKKVVNTEPAIRNFTVLE